MNKDVNALTISKFKEFMKDVANNDLFQNDIMCEIDTFLANYQYHKSQTDLSDTKISSMTTIFQ